MAHTEDFFLDKTIAKIVVHCSASEWGHATIINEWHEKRWGQLMPEGRPAIGYNAVILNGYVTYDHYQKREPEKLFIGAIEIGRPWDADDQIEDAERGAHVYGFNKNTMSLCLIGNNAFAKQQIFSAWKLCNLWAYRFGIPLENVVGHYEFPGVNKTCPNLDMDIFRSLLKTKAEAYAIIRALHNVKGVI